MIRFNSVQSLAVTALFFLVSISSAMAQPPDELFINRPEWVNPGPHGLSAHAAPVDTSLISRGVKNIRILLPDGTEAKLERDGFEKRGPGNSAWRGRVAGDEGSRATLTLKNGWVFGQIYFDGRIYEIKPQRGRKVIVEELDSASFPDCAVDASFSIDTASEVQGSGAASTGDPAPAGDASVVMDLLSVYTPQARTAAGGVSQIEAHIQAAADAANTAFIDSNMNVRFRLVHTAEVAHNDAGNMDTDLVWLRADVGVASLRDQYGADMVSLITEDGAGSCGLGYVQRSPGPDFEDWAFQVTARGCAVGNLTFAHEHGHNMGMEHNPENSGTTSSGASYPHSFAHYIDGSYRTVMSYSDQCSNGCSRASFFSNPDVSHNGYATGIADARDNARTGDLTGPVVSDFRATAVPPAGGTRFAMIGDYGSDDSDFDERDVADLVASWAPDFVITAGDNRYGSIQMDSAVGQYYCDFLTNAGSGSYCSGGNAATNAFFPSLGNHDYTDGGGISEYLNYFTLPGAGVSTTGTSSSEKFYDFVQGPVHFFVLNSEESSTIDTQKAWLQQQLGASTTPWQVVYFHSAPYSSGASHGSDPSMQWPFASWGADAVFSGHDHTYERLEIDGIPYFVNGLGGMSRYSFGTPLAGSIVRYRDNYGAMLVDATDTAVTFQFINVAGAVIDTHTVTQGDSGSGGVLNIRVSQPSDDAEELTALSPVLGYATGHMTLTSTDLEMVDDSGWHGGDQAVGVRFQNVDIPQGATILAAYLEFATDEAGSAATTIDIRAQDSDDAATFSTTAYNISSRPTTSASGSWTVPGWSTIGKLRTTTDLTEVVQEVVDRAGWAANNSMAFIITGSGDRTAEAYDGDTGLAPLLHVEYETSLPQFNLPYLEDFDDGQAQYFTSQDSSWEVAGGVYEVNTAQNPSLTIFDQDINEQSALSIGAVIEGVGGSWLNGYIVFDYVSPTNYKFAGPFIGANLWRLGHNTGDGLGGDVELSETLNLGSGYDVKVLLNGTVATLYADGVKKLAFDFGDNLLDGKAGLGVGQANTRFDDFRMDAEVPNQLPTADFSSSSADLTADFVDTSSDSDGSIVNWAWTFGDGNTSSVQNPSHTYAAEGTYQVNLTVTDNDGATNTASQSVTVTVPDTTPPSITAPADVGAEATGETTPVNLGTPTVSDDTDPNPAVSNDAPAAFPVGVSMVTWTVADAAGNSATATQTVTVTDTTPPIISAPGDISVESSEPVAVALGTPTVSDLADPNPTVTNNAPALFPLGTTTVTWKATDASGNSTSGTQTVTVSVPAPQPPTAPSNLTATVEQSGKGKNMVVTDITLNWADNSNNETGFVLEGCQEVQTGKGKNKTVTCDFVELGTVGVDVTTFAVDIANQHDNFRVKAVNDVGSSGYSNTEGI